MDLWGNSENHGVNEEEMYLPVSLRRGEVVPLSRETKSVFQYLVTILLKIYIGLHSHARNPLQRGITYMTVGYILYIKTNKDNLYKVTATFIYFGFL